MNITKNIVMCVMGINFQITSLSILISCKDVAITNSLWIVQEATIGNVVMTYDVFIIC